MGLLFSAAGFSAWASLLGAGQLPAGPIAATRPVSRGLGLAARGYIAALRAGGQLPGTQQGLAVVAGRGIDCVFLWFS
ncbi:hypothetical protein GCM10027288_10750 [Bordetella tumbae]